MFEGFETTDVQVAGARVHMRVGGAGDPVLLLHGYPETGGICAGSRRRELGGGPPDRLPDACAVGADGLVGLSYDALGGWPECRCPQTSSRAAMAATPTCTRPGWSRSPETLAPC